MLEKPAGIEASETHIKLQSAAWAELVNKLAWAIGSTYRVPYKNPKAGVRVSALSLAHVVLNDHGYPSHLKN